MFAIKGTRIRLALILQSCEAWGVLAAHAVCMLWQIPLEVHVHVYVHLAYMCMFSYTVLLSGWDTCLSLPCMVWYPHWTRTNLTWLYMYMYVHAYNAWTCDISCSWWIHTAVLMRPRFTCWSASWTYTYTVYTCMCTYTCTCMSNLPRTFCVWISHSYLDTPRLSLDVQLTTHALWVHPGIVRECPSNYS